MHILYIINISDNIYRLRVIVWECRNVEYHDEQTNANDLYITGSLQSTASGGDDANPQETDLHFRSHNGRGSFNWRMKFPIKLPKRKKIQYPRLRLQIWDRDFFTPSDCISECVIPLAGFLRFCEINGGDKRCKMVQNEDEEIWINLNNRKKVDNIKKINVGDQIKDEINKGVDKVKEGVNLVKDLMLGDIFGTKGKGEIKISIELLSEKYVKLLPAGFGRDLPNRNPFLPEPTGRHKFSLFHPCDALRRLFGDRLCIKLCCFCCWLVCIMFIVLITPNLVSAITANIITG